MGNYSYFLSESGIFGVQATHHYWSGGLNVNVALGSRLTMNQGTFSDYHYSGYDVTLYTVIVGHAEEPGLSHPDNVFPSPGIFYDEVFHAGIHNSVCSRLSKN